MTERRTGTAEGVPYLAIPPPEGTENPGLVAVLHGLDHPNSEDTMAATLPLQDMPAWRVYLGLPMSGTRAPEGGAEGDHAPREGRRPDERAGAGDGAGG